jgi:hypothetical protein
MQPVLNGRLTRLALADAATGAEPALDLAHSDPKLLMLVAECQQLLTRTPLPAREVLECVRSLLSQQRGVGAAATTAAAAASAPTARPAGRVAVPMNAKRDESIARLQESHANATGMSLGSMLEFRANIEREKAGFEVRPPLSLVEYAGAYNKLKEARGGDCFNAPDAAHDFRFDRASRRQPVPNIDHSHRLGRGR